MQLDVLDPVQTLEECKLEKDFWADAIISRLQKCYALQAAAAAGQEAADLLQRARVAEKEAASLGNALRTLEQRVAAQKVESERQLDTVKRQAIAGAAQARHAEQARSHLDAELADIKSAHIAAMHEKDSLQARLVEKTAEHAHTTQEFTAMEARLSDLASTEVSLREELEAVLGEVAALLDGLAGRDAELEQYRAAAEGQHADSSALGQQLAELAASKQALQEQQRSSQTAHAEEVSNLQRTAAELEAALTASEQKIVDLQAEGISSETELSSLGEALSQLQHRESRLRAQNETLQQDALKAQSLHSDLVEQLQQSQLDAAARTASLQLKLEGLQVARDGATKQLQATRALSDTHCAELQQEIERLRQSETASTAQCSHLQTQLRQLQDDNDEAEQCSQAGEANIQASNPAAHQQNQGLQHIVEPTLALALTEAMAKRGHPEGCAQEDIGAWQRAICGREPSEAQSAALQRLLQAMSQSTAGAQEKLQEPELAARAEAPSLQAALEQVLTSHITCHETPACAAQSIGTNNTWTPPYLVLRCMPSS